MTSNGNKQKQRIIVKIIKAMQKCKSIVYDAHRLSPCWAGVELG